MTRTLLVGFALRGDGRGEEVDDGGDGLGVLQEEAVATVEEAELCTGDGVGQELAVLGWGDAVVEAPGHQGGATDGGEAVGRVVVAARLELQALAGSGRGSGRGEPLDDH